MSIEVNSQSKKRMEEIVISEIEEGKKKKESVGLEYAHVRVVASLLADYLTGAMRDDFTQIVLSYKDSEGLFISNAWDGPEMECASSAVRALKLCGSLAKLDKPQTIVEWIKKQQNKDGGFGGVTDWYLRCTKPVSSPDGHSSEETTVQPVRKDSSAHACYFAYQALEALDVLDQVNLKDMGNFLISTQRDDGSWGFHPDNPMGNTITTAMALHVLNKLDRLEKIKKEEIINWLVSQQLSDGGFSWLGKESWVLSTARAAKALRLLKALDRINLQSFEGYWDNYELNSCWDIICFYLAAGHPLAMGER